jgi:uncharacterized protein (TIGR02145 family)
MRNNNPTTRRFTMKIQLNRKGRVSLPLFTATIALALAFTGCIGGYKSDVKSEGVKIKINEKENGSFTDPRDDKTYRYVIIGKDNKKQIWMAENLNYNAKGSKCYNDEPEECEKYGRLYDWATAMGIDKNFNKDRWRGDFFKSVYIEEHQGICPAGWHLPTPDEWFTLAENTGDSFFMGYYRKAGKKLKAKHSWGESGEANGTDDYGFSALASGYCSFNGTDCTYMREGAIIASSYSMDNYSNNNYGKSTNTATGNNALNSKINSANTLAKSVEATSKGLSNLEKASNSNSAGGVLLGSWWSTFDYGDKSSVIYMGNHSNAFLVRGYSKQFMYSVRCVRD